MKQQEPGYPHLIPWPTSPVPATLDDFLVESQSPGSAARTARRSPCRPIVRSPSCISIRPNHPDFLPLHSSGTGHQDVEGTFHCDIIFNPRICMRSVLPSSTRSSAWAILPGKWPGRVRIIPFKPRRNSVKATNKAISSFHTSGYAQAATCGAGGKDRIAMGDQ